MGRRSTALTMALAACATAAPGLVATHAEAQTALPGIVVDTASPIASSPPAGGNGGGGQDVPPLAGTAVVIDDSFVPVTVVTERELLADAGPTITGALEHRPGIWGSTFAPGANRPIIRGLDNYRVRVQIDGIDAHDVSALSEDHAVPIDPLSAESVEVVRGPATLRYGSQAIGGVVSVKSNRIPMFVPRRGWMGEVKGGMSSVDKGREGAFSVTAGEGGFVAHADGFRRESEDYDTPRGRVENSFVKSNGFGLGLSYVWRSGFVGLSFSRIKSLYGIPGRAEEHHEEENGHDHDHDHEEEEHAHRPVIDMVQDRVQIKGEWRLRTAGIEAVRAWLGWTDYAHDEVIDEDGEKLVGTRFTNKAFEGRFELQHLPVLTSFGELRGAVGVHIGTTRLRGFAVDEPVDGLLDPAKSEMVAGFWFEELRVTKRLRFQVATRVEQTKADGTGIEFDASDPGASPAINRSREFTPVSGSAGVLYDLPAGVVVSLTGQYVERAPALPELTIAKVQSVLPDAIAFAILGAIESLLSAVVADGMTGRRHRSNCELVAQGVANIGSGLFGGFCVTGTIARTATNVRAGAHGPVAGMLHAAFLLGFMIVAAPLASYIPLAALAGVLAVVAWNMIEKPAIRALIRSSRGDLLVLVATFGLTIFRDLTEGIIVGVALGALLFIHRMSQTISVEAGVPLVREDEADSSRGDRRRQPDDGDDPDTVVYRITGAFFFGAAATVGSVLDRIADQRRNLVLDFSQVPFLDSTAANLIESVARKAERGGVRLVVSGASRPVRRMLLVHGLRRRRVRFARDIPDALRMIDQTPRS